MADAIQRYLFEKETEEKVKSKQLAFFMKNFADKEDDIKPSQSFMDAKAKDIKELMQVENKIKQMKINLKKFQEDEKKRLAIKIAEPLPPEPVLSYMYPIPIDDTDQDEGRASYLRKRNELLPNQKYRVAPTHNFDYGWPTERLKAMSKIPEFGRIPFSKINKEFGSASEYFMKTETESAAPKLNESKKITCLQQKNVKNKNSTKPPKKIIRSYDKVLK